MSEDHSGRCLCGAVRFRTRGRLRDVIACHCNQCRRQTGHFYAATNVQDDGLTVEGGENITWYRASETAGRGPIWVMTSAATREPSAAASVSAKPRARPRRKPEA